MIERKPPRRKTRDKTPISIYNELLINHINPLTPAQNLAFNEFDLNNKNLFLMGSPGTGKSFISLYLAIDGVYEKDFEKLIIIRSSEPSKKIGFLPGKVKEKMEEYERPYKDIFTEIFNKSNAYDLLKNRNIVEFMSTSFLRSLTFDNTIIVVDECQNLQWNELYAVITRLGKNSRIIFSGDYAQSDLSYSNNVNVKGDILKFIKVIENMNEFSIIKFGTADIVRSGLVKSFIINCEKLGYV